MLIYFICTQYLVGASFALINAIYSLWGSGLVSLLASQAHQHHGHLSNLVLLAVWAGAKSCWKMKSASLKSALKFEVL